jgi:hypothetical protein
MLRSTALIPGSILAAVLALLPGTAAGQTPATPQTTSPQSQPADPNQGTQNQGTTQGTSQGSAQQGTQGSNQGDQGAPATTPEQGTAPGQAGTVDPRAREIAEKVMLTMGGRQAWESSRFFRFTFAGRRRHYWDKFDGRHRLEGQNAQGQTFVVLSNLNTKEGTATLDGQQADGELLKQMIDGAHAAWVNDTYWLLFPFKLLDPGVNLGYQGTETIEGQTYDVLTLTFQGGTGLTPGDRYWAYVNQASNAMDRWGFILQGQPEGTQQTQWLWQGWNQFGRILLAPTRIQVGGEGPESRIEFTDLAVLETLPDTIFTSPEPPAGQPANQ